VVRFEKHTKKKKVKESTLLLFLSVFINYIKTLFESNFFFVYFLCFMFYLHLHLALLFSFYFFTRLPYFP
jgi:hypothetical protein